MVVKMMICIIAVKKMVTGMISVRMIFVTVIMVINIKGMPMVGDVFHIFHFWMIMSIVHH